MKPESYAQDIPPVLSQSRPPRIKFEHGRFLFDHPDQGTGAELFKESLATDDTDFLLGIVTQAIKIANSGNSGEKIDESTVNVMFSMIRGIRPRDELETMLAMQMVSVHFAMMKMAKRLAASVSLEHQDSASNAFNKLARTFTTQVEALKRYRSTGEQKLTVQHVNVSDGGQAVIGQINEHSS